LEAQRWSALVGTTLPVYGTFGGNWPPVTAGQTWLATDGRRFVLVATSYGVVYYANGKFFKQSARGFIGEVTTYPFYAAGRASLWLADVAEFEVRVMMGFVAGSSGAGFVSIVGLEVAEFVQRNKENFGKWYRMLMAVLEVRAILKLVAPTLYDKVFNAVLKQVLDKLPEAVTPDAVAFGLGVIVGAMGKKVFLKGGKLTILSVLFVVLEQIVMRFSLSVAPVAAKLALADFRKFADDIVRTLKEVGVAIRDEDIRKIVEEVQKHPREIKRAFDKLKAAFSEDDDKGTSRSSASVPGAHAVAR
jgi:hypothetical protein